MGVASIMSIVKIATSDERTYRICLPSNPDVVGERTPLRRDETGLDASDQGERYDVLEEVMYTGMEGREANQRRCDALVDRRVD
jgi:hypothetical protein